MACARVSLAPWTVFALFSLVLVACGGSGHKSASVIPTATAVDAPTGPTPSPTEPTPTPTPIDPLVVQNQAFSYDGKLVSYAFTAQSIDPAAAYEASRYQVSFFDAADNPLGVDAGSFRSSSLSKP